MENDSGNHGKRIAYTPPLTNHLFHFPFSSQPLLAGLLSCSQTLCMPSCMLFEFTAGERSPCHFTYPPLQRQCLLTVCRADIPLLLQLALV